MNGSHQDWQPFPNRLISTGLIVLGVIWPCGVATATVMAMNESRDFRPDDSTIAVVLAVCLLGILFVGAGLIRMKSLQRLPRSEVAEAVIAMSLLWMVSFAVAVVVLLMRRGLSSC